MFYVYILYSASSNKYYVGYTSDYTRRLKEHNSSDRSTYTSKHRPWTLEAVFSYNGTEAEVIQIEKFIKRQKSRKLIVQMIGNKTLTGILAQLVRVPQVRD